MIKYPKDLIKTAELVGYKPMTLNEDVIGDLSKYWLRVGKIIKQETDWPKKETSTIWDPNVIWSHGHDRPLDTFVEFYDDYPIKHGHDAAAQAPTISGALNSVAAIVTTHKYAAIAALKVAKDHLSGNGHILGSQFHSILGIHLQRYTSHDQEDRQTINTVSNYLSRLNNQTTSDIDTQVKIISKASATFDSIIGNIAATVASLRGASKDIKSSAKYRDYRDYDSWLSSDDPGPDTVRST